MQQGANKRTKVVCVLLAVVLFYIYAAKKLWWKIDGGTVPQSWQRGAGSPVRPPARELLVNLVFSARAWIIQ